MFFFFPQIAIAIGVLTSNRGGGRRTLSGISGVYAGIIFFFLNDLSGNFCLAQLHRSKDIWLPSHFPHEGCFFCPKKPYRHVQLSRWSLGVGFPKIWVKIRMQFDSCRLERGWQKTTSWSCVFLWNFFHVQKRDVAKKKEERVRTKWYISRASTIHSIYTSFKKESNAFCSPFLLLLGKGGSHAVPRGGRCWDGSPGCHLRRRGGAETRRRGAGQGGHRNGRRRRACLRRGVASGEERWRGEEKLLQKLVEN